MYSFKLKKFLCFSLIALFLMSMNNKILGEDIYKKNIDEFLEILKKKQIEMAFSFNDPEIRKIMKRLCEPNAILIEFRTIEKNNEKKLNVIAQGKLWFSNGRLFIKQNSNRDGDIYNYATVNNKIYEWQKRKSNGHILNRTAYDTLKYLVYFIDAGGFKLSIYKDYRKNPKSFIVSDESDKVVLIYKESPNNMLIGISLIEEPFWLKELIIQEDANKKIIHAFDEPKEIDEIPPEALEIPKDIEWEKVDYSLEKWLRYL